MNYLIKYKLIYILLLLGNLPFWVQSVSVETLPFILSYVYYFMVNYYNFKQISEQNIGKFVLWTERIISVSRMILVFVMGTYIYAFIFQVFYSILSPVAISFWLPYMMLFNLVTETFKSMELIFPILTGTVLFCLEFIYLRRFNRFAKAGF